MIIRQTFYDGFRREFGKLTQEKLTAIEFILNKLDNSERFNKANEYAYILSTIKHETADSFLPIREFGKGKGNHTADYTRMEMFIMGAGMFKLHGIIIIKNSVRY